MGTIFLRRTKQDPKIVEVDHMPGDHGGIISLGSFNSDDPATDLFKVAYAFSPREIGLTDDDIETVAYIYELNSGELRFDGKPTNTARIAKALRALKTGKAASA